MSERASPKAGGWNFSTRWTVKKRPVMPSRTPKEDMMFHDWKHSATQWILLNPRWRRKFTNPRAWSWTGGRRSVCRCVETLEALHKNYDCQSVADFSELEAKQYMVALKNPRREGQAKDNCSNTKIDRTLHWNWRMTTGATTLSHRPETETSFGAGS